MEVESNLNIFILEETLEARAHNLLASIFPDLQIFAVRIALHKASIGWDENIHGNTPNLSSVSGGRSFSPQNTYCLKFNDSGIYKIQ